MRSRMLPRISSRVFFMLTALAALIAAVARAAGSGGAVAFALIVGLGFAAACFALFALLFLIAWGISSLRAPEDPDALEGSPFAEGQLPPQILPPREQRS